MKKALTMLMAAMLLIVPTALAGINWTGPVNGSGASAGDVDPGFEDWFVFYPMDLPGYGSRNPNYPEYEYAFEGETLHIMCKISDTTIFDVENMDVDARIQWYGFGAIDNPAGTATAEDTTSVPSITDFVQLYMCTGTGATYDSATGRYVASYCGDYIVPDAATRAGLGFFDCVATDPALNQHVEDLATSLNPLYENVNNILANPTIVLTSSSGLSFTGMLVNQYNDADTYPIVITLNTDDDEEGQGIIGNLSLAVTNMIGATFPTDILYASNIRFKVDASGVWTTLPDNAYGMMPTTWVQFATDVSTDGVGYSQQLYFEIWFDANHIDSAFVGGDLWLLYVIV